MRARVIATLIIALTVLGAFAALVYEGMRGWDASYSNYNLYTNAQLDANRALNKVQELEAQIANMEAQLTSATTTAGENAQLQESLRNAKNDLTYYQGLAQSQWPTMYAESQSMVQDLRQTIVAERFNSEVRTVTEYVYIDDQTSKAYLVRFNPADGNPDCGSGCLTVYMFPQPVEHSQDYEGMRLKLEVMVKCGTLQEGYHCGPNATADDYGFHLYLEATANAEGVARFTNVPPDALVRVFNPLNGAYVDADYLARPVHGSELPATFEDTAGGDGQVQFRTRAGYEPIIEVYWDGSTPAEQ